MMVTRNPAEDLPAPRKAGDTRERGGEASEAASPTCAQGGKIVPRISEAWDRRSEKLGRSATERHES